MGWIPPAALSTELPVVRISHDNTRLDRSCRVEIADDAVIEDLDGDGIIQIAASGVTVEFAPGAVLRGGPVGRPPDQQRGCGIRIVDASDVTVRGASLERLHVGIWATRCDRLRIESCTGRDLRRDRLRSSPLAEDAADWLWPHQNDENEWLTRYGAALYIEDSAAVAVVGCRVRTGQNGLCLDRVAAAHVVGNDFSFLSGWGLALWRTSGCEIRENRLDFCIRGYSHGVYNRGQDSAGILLFEQSCDNLIIANSVTHGGDGLFGFAGKEALGEHGGRAPPWHLDRGCNRNRLLDNDFSYAAAHGVELTFSFDNEIRGNRLVGNAITGIWGGYSSRTTISDNWIEENGTAGYGLERGGVNIEHGRANQITGNRFQANTCGVHLWTDSDPGIAKLPWAAVNEPASRENVITGNLFEREPLAVHLRGAGQVWLGPNEYRDVGELHRVDPAHAVESPARFPAEPPVEPISTLPAVKRPAPPASGPAHGTSPRRPPARLPGRQNIIMGEWGPWDHESPLVRLRKEIGRVHEFEVFGAPNLRPELLAGDVEVQYEPLDQPGRPVCVRVSTKADGVHPYTLELRGDGLRERRSGVVVAATWRASFFAWPADCDPRERLADWRALALSPQSITVDLDGLHLPYGGRGPSALRLDEALSAARLPADRFGMIARATVPLSAGRWHIATHSDDGVRVLVDGRTILENWTWHAPTRDEAAFDVAQSGRVELLVEHFEIDGHAVLELALTPASGD